MLSTRILALCLLPLALAAPAKLGLAPLSVAGEVVGDGYIVVMKDEAVVGGLRGFEMHLGEVEEWAGVDVSMRFEWWCGCLCGHGRCLMGDDEVDRRRMVESYSS